MTGTAVGADEPDDGARERERAAKIGREWLKATDPEHAAVTVLQALIEAWAVHEARVQVLHDCLEAMGVDVWARPARQGAKLAGEIVLAAERAAADARDKLGLTPARWLRIQADLGIAKRAAEETRAALGEVARKVL